MHTACLGQGFFLTPELKTDDRWVPWVQLAIALSALNRRTVPLIGLGAAVLFVAAVAQYGVFHMLDYLIVIGVSYYFLAAAMSDARLVDVPLRRALRNDRAHAAVGFH